MTPTGTIVRSLRQELRWTMWDLARQAKLTERTIMNMEARKAVARRTYTQVVSVLNAALPTLAQEWSIPRAALKVEDLFQPCEKRSLHRSKVARIIPTTLDKRRQYLQDFLRAKVAQQLPTPPLQQERSA